MKYFGLLYLASAKESDQEIMILPEPIFAMIRANDEFTDEL